jgi:hypothetical protein
VRRVKSFGSVLSHLKPLREHFGDWRALVITFPAILVYNGPAGIFTLAY